MNKSSFERLSDERKLVLIHQSLIATSDPRRVFGDDHTAVYHKLSRFIYPDRFPDHQQIANEAQSRLNVLRDQLRDGKFLTDAKNRNVEVGGITYQVHEQPLGSGEIADVYYGRARGGGHYAFKVIRSADDYELLDREYEILIHLMRSRSWLINASPYMPRIAYSDAIDGLGWSNIFSYSDNVDPRKLYSLSDIAKHYDNDIPIRSLGWIWNRLLFALSFASLNGVIHRAVVPDNILVDPKNHRCFLIDWVHASRDGDLSNTIIKSWHDLYPQQLLDQSTPQVHWDLFMAAKTMMLCYKNMPDAMHRYMEWCTDKNPSHRPNSAAVAHTSWAQVLHVDLGWKREWVAWNFDPDKTEVDFAWWW